MGLVALTSGPRAVQAYMPPPASRRYTPPKAAAKPVRQAGQAPAQGGSLNELWTKVMSDPGVQKAQQQKATKQAEDSAWDKASFWDKVGSVAGTALQPLEYLNYPRRAIETGVLEVMEALSDNPDDWGHIFKDPAAIRGGRSNWDLISGKPSEETGKGGLGFGDFIVNMPKGPEIPIIPDFVPLLPQVEIKPGETANRAIGAFGDIGLDPFSRMGSAPSRIINPAERALSAAGRAGEAGTSAIDDLEKLLTKGGAAPVDIEEAITRTQSQLTAMQRAQQIAAETKPGLREIELPTGRGARASWVADLRANEPAIYEAFKTELPSVARKGFSSASPELREALGMRTGLGFRAEIAGKGRLARIPGTGAIARGLSTPAEGIRFGLSKLPGGHWRDPEGLSKVYDTLLRGKTDMTLDDATARLAYENSRRVSEGLVRSATSRQIKTFDREYLRGVRKEGREAVERMMTEAETTGNTPFNEIFRDVLKTYSDITGHPISPEFLLDQGTYVPHRMTQGFKRFLREHKDDGSVIDFGKANDGFLTEDLLDQARSITRKRSFLPGTEHEIGGQTITIGDGTIADLNEVFKTAFPGFKGKFYEDDPARLLESYATSRAKEAGNQAAGNYLANNPAFASNAGRITGEIYDELIARNEALARDPVSDLISKPYDPQASADFAHDYLGAPRGPDDPGLTGPRLPSTPTSKAGRNQLPTEWVDDPDSIFRSVKAKKATQEREGVFKDLGDDWRQASDKVDIAPDWRRQATTKVRQSVAEAREHMRDLRTNVMHGLRNAPKMDSGPIKELTDSIRRMKQQVRNWTLKQNKTTTELEGVLHSVTNDIGDLEDELARVFDDQGRLVMGTSQKVRKDLESKLRQLKKVQAEAQEKLNTAPTRLRVEAAERTQALQAPVDAARKKLRQAEAATYATEGVSKRQLENAAKVLEEKAGSTFDEDAARLAELDSIVNAPKPEPPAKAAKVDPAVKAEYRTLKSKFTRNGEHGAEGRARATAAKGEAARKAKQDSITAAQRELDAAKEAAQVRHEMVVQGEPEIYMNVPPGMPEEYAYQLDIPPEENPGPVLTGFEPGGDVTNPEQGLGLGVGEERHVVPPAQQTPAQRAAAELAERRRVLNKATGDVLPVKGASEAEAIQSVLKEAEAIEGGLDSEVGKAVTAANKAVEEQGEKMLPGAISEHPQVVAAKEAYNKAVAENLDKTAAMEAHKEAVVEASTSQLLAAQVGIDQRTAQVQDMVAKRAELMETRAYHAEERKQVQRELYELGKKARPGRRANLEEMLKVYDDLELIGWVNPQIQDAAMAQTESLLNNMLTKLRSAQAQELTQNHVRKMVTAAYRGELAPVMRSGMAAGWTLQRKDLMPALGDVFFNKTLHESLQNVYQIIDDPTRFGRAFSALTNMFKTYATLSPGFHVRNALSAIFMNTSDGVSLVNQARGAKLWTQYMRSGDDWLGRQSADVQQAFEATFGSGAGGRFGEAGFAETQFGVGRKAFNRAMSNKVTRASQHAGQWVEGGVRLGMALDSIASGSTVSEALERITRIHFDYGQISKMDATARAFIPFWTFYSRNLPLQIEQMWLKPRAYSQFQSVMSAAPPDKEYTPEYWDNPGNWNTGAEVSGGTLYGNLDLPFTRSAQQIRGFTNLLQADPKEFLSQLNPWMAAPLELGTNSDFFTGRQYDRKNFKDYEQVSGIGGIPINLLAKVFGQQKGGKTYEPFTNALLSVLPMMDRTARLVPGVLDVGKSKAEPQWASYARFGGAPIRVLTPEAQETEKQRQFYDRKDEIKMQRAIQQYLAQQQAN